MSCEKRCSETCPYFKKVFGFYCLVDEILGHPDPNLGECTKVYINFTHPRVRIGDICSHPENIK